MGREAEGGQLDRAPGRIQQAQHHRFAGGGGDGRDADIDGAAVLRSINTAAAVEAFEPEVATIEALGVCMNCAREGKTTL